MAQIILAQLQQALRAVMAAGSEAFGEGMEETSDASRQLALMQSLALMVGKMADGIEQDSALAHWTRQILQMLEDNSATLDMDVPLVMRFRKAVGEMQALLGVPEEVRAWKPELRQKADEDFPLPVRVQDAQGYAKQAGSVVWIFLATLSRAGLPEAEGLCVTALAERLATTLEAASTAPTVRTYAERIASAKTLLHALSGSLESDSDALWGLIRGIGASLEDAELDMELEAQRAAEAEAAEAQADGEAVQPGKPLPEGTTSFVRFARHLLAMLLPVAGQHAPDAVDHLRRVDGLLQVGSDAKTCQEWRAIMDPAQEALGLAAGEWASVPEPAAYPLWGLYWGIEAALEKGEEWKEQDIPDKSRIGADYSGSLADLPGVPGKRADVALGCAIEIEQAASWLLAEVERKPYDHERPFSRMLREIKRQASLVISACDDDEKTLEELQQQAA